MVRIVLHYLLLKNGFCQLIQLAPVQNNAVLEKGSDLSPEARLFIIRLFVIHGASVSFSGTVKSLVKECDSDDRAVRKGMDYLKQAGLITQVRDSSGKTLYQVRGFIQQYIVSRSPAGSPPPPLHEQIDAVLFPEHGDNPERVKRGGFSRASRYLLAVMLAHSDALGMVTGVSNAELRKLTGMTEQRLRGQIKNLLDSSILCGYMPGFNGRAVLGKVKSEFSLWLPHAVFGACSSRYGSIEYVEDRLSKSDRNEISVIDKMYSLANLKSLERIKVNIARPAFFGVHFSVEEINSVIDECGGDYLRWAVLAVASHLIREGEFFIEAGELFTVFDILLDSPRKVKPYELKVCSFIACRFMNEKAGYRFDESDMGGFNSGSLQLRFKVALFICRASLMLASRVNRALDLVRESRPDFCFLMLMKSRGDYTVRNFSIQFFNSEYMITPSPSHSLKIFASGGHLDSGEKAGREIELFEVSEGVSKLLVSRLDDFSM